MRTRQLLSHNEFVLLEQAEREIVALTPIADDSKIRGYLDDFYGHRLPQTGSGRLIGLMKPVGGRRKAETPDSFSTRMGEPLSSWTVVGDSITDFKMLEAVNKTRGLAIASNANEYALKYASMSLASARLDDLWPVLEAWQKWARPLVEKLVLERQEAGGARDREWFHWLDGMQDVTPVLEIHKRVRRLVREEAAQLG
jgi:predicted HAD superfamily phosphohydrolase